MCGSSSGAAGARPASVPTRPKRCRRHRCRACFRGPCSVSASGRVCCSNFTPPTVPCGGSRRGSRRRACQSHRERFQTGMTGWWRCLRRCRRRSLRISSRRRWCTPTKPPGGSGSSPRRARRSRAWLWIATSVDAVYLHVDASRSAAAAATLLGGLRKGAVLVCDRYSAYKKLARLAAGRLVLAFCWAHVRRDFIKVAAARGDLL